MSHSDTPKHSAKTESKTTQPTLNTERRVPKPESSSEYEGAPSREPSGKPGAEIKTETSSSSGE